MAINTMNRFAIRDVAKATFYDLKTNNILCYLDTLKSSGVQTKSESVYLRGGSGNAKLLGFSSNKEATLTLEDALFSMETLSMLTGNELVTGTKNVQFREVLTATSNTITLTKTPVGDLKGLYLLNTDGSNGTEITKGDPATNEDEYSIAAKIVTLHSTITNGTQIVVYYDVATATDAKTIRITSDSFPASFKVVLDVLVTSYSDKQLYPAQLTIFNAKANDDWNFEMKPDGDPSVLSLPLEVLKNPTSTDMWQMTIYDADDIV